MPQAEQIAAQGAPYPYPSPLPVAVFDVHHRAAARALRRWYWTVGRTTAAGLALLLVAVPWRGGPTRFLLMAATAIGITGLVAAVPHLRAARRHRAVLVAYDLPSPMTSWVGLLVVSVEDRWERMADTIDVPAAARRALRAHMVLVAGCVVLLLAHTAVCLWAFGRIDARQAMWVLMPAYLAVYAIAAVLVLLLRAPLRRVRAGSRGRHGSTRSGSGFWLLLVALIAGSVAGSVANSIALAREPGRVVTSEARPCPEARSNLVCGTWEVDGRRYSGAVPFRTDRIGEVVQFEVSAARPDVVLTERDPAAVRYGLVGVAVIGIVLLARRWRASAETFRADLRDAVHYRKPPASRPET